MKRIAMHLIFWLTILLWRANGDYITDASLGQFILFNLLRLPIIIIASYFLLYFILPEYVIKQKDYYKFSAIFAINFFLAFYLDQQLILSGWMRDIINASNHFEYKALTNLHPFRNSFHLLSIMGLAAAIRFFKLYLEKEKREHQLVQDQLEMQHAFLKAQVNPHFLFNALNNLYSMAVQKNEQEIAEGLDGLSGIMHYLTYESKASLVPLEKEVKLVQDYLDIQRLRLAETDDITISFNIDGELGKLQIAPVILLPLVENAFKHGVKPEHNCLVSITLSLNENQMNFKTHNKIFAKGEKEIMEKGIGLENVQKRLDLIYSEKYQFKTFQADGHFFTELQLDLC